MKITNSSFASHWPIRRVGDICESIVPGRNKPDSFGGDIPWITIADLADFYVTSSKAGLAVTSKIAKECGNKIIPRNAVLMSCVGQFGLVGIAKRDVVINQQLHAFTCPSGMDPYFLATVLQIQQPYMERIATQTTIKYMNKAACESVPVPLPPLPEQRKIAQILGTWDEAIATTEKLITALERRKQGLMQRLLTGQVRKKWQVAQLSEIAQVILSGVDKKTREGDMPVRLCNYTDVFYNAYITDTMPFMEATATQREIEKCTLRKDDVIITKDSETVAEIAQAATIDESLSNVICGYHLAIIRPNPELVYGPFLRELIMTPDIHYQFEKSANGVTRFGLTGSAIESVEIPFPCLERQRQIVDVLRTNDRAVDALNDYRSQLEVQKKGLMQRLLTGQVRVNVQGE